MIGVWELIIILGILALMAAAVVGVVFLAVWLSKRNVSSPVPPPAASTVRLATCPRCGLPLPADAPQGLCPRCVLQVGFETQDAAEPAFQDAAGRPNAPNPRELAAHFPQLEIIELLGQGGMGAVYKARQKDLDRFVALKVLPGGAGRDPAFAERFMREARALAKLSHPNIVAVHDFGQIQRTGGSDAADGKHELLYYFVMEFIDGPNLRQLMQNQRLSPREAMTIVPQICEALQFAHDGGVVHRDIKPENILLDKKGRVKIADFGIAKIAGKRGDFSLTGAKDVIGTPHYMAPEQVEHPTEVDHRADIYSLGVVFYEMLTGELPLGNFAVPSSRARGMQVDVRLDEVVLRALEKEPARRYQHASEVKTDVETIAGGAPASNVENRSTADRTNQRRLAPTTVTADSRLSRLAVAGACWAPLFFITTALMLFFERAVPVLEGGTPPGPPWWQIGLSLTLLPLGFTAPFGTTLCGVVALSKIRRSGGRLCGLGLALFDALLFPLLILDGLIVWLVDVLMCQSLEWVGFQPGTEVPIGRALLPALLITIVTNVWLVRWAWHSAKRMSGQAPTAQERESAAIWTRVAVPVSVILLLGAASLMVPSLLHSKHRAEDDPNRMRQLEELRREARRTVSPAGLPSPVSAAALAHVPPVVVHTIPEAGSTQVDSSLTELRVTFSKPMKDGNWSWCNLGDGSYPETTGKPHYLDDGRSCVLPVKLEPGRVYATWINVDRFQSFQDREGQPAVPYLLIFRTGD